MSKESGEKRLVSVYFIEGQEDARSPEITIRSKDITVTFPGAAKSTYVFKIGADGKLIRPLGLINPLFEQAIALAEAAHRGVKINDIQKPAGNEN